MFAKTNRWIRSQRKSTAAIVVAILFFAFNVFAYRHAWTMTHFVSEGERTPPPETLTFGQKLKAVALGVQIPKPSNARTPYNFDLPFTVHWFKSSDGTRLESWFIPCPNATNLVILFHGYASCRANLLHEAAAFRNLGYATMLMDFRGSGGSGGSETTIGVREADDVAAAIAYAHNKWPRLTPILYGQSMGSVAILRALAIQHLQPQAIIIENPFDRLTTTVANRFKTMHLPSFPFAQALVFWGGLQCGFNVFQHNPIEYASSVSCPVLLLHGEKDMRVSKAQAEAIFANLASARKTLKLFPNAGHESLLRASEDDWKEAVKRFLASK